MRSKRSLCIKVLIVLCLSIVCVARDFDFFYFVQQWPGSYCDTKGQCCYPPTGKPAADFGIHGLWPNYNDGSYPQNCPSGSHFDHTQITKLIGRMRESWPTLSCPSNDGFKFWRHEWEKHGRCSESVLNQYAYFETALSLKCRANLLQSLANAGIKPDGSSYRLSSIKAAIRDGIGFAPLIECNVGESGRRQLYQVYLCVDRSGSRFIQCPVHGLPNGRCSRKIEFPSF